MIGVVCDPVQVSSVRLFSSIGEQAKVLENVVLCMCSDPCAI